MIDRPRQVWLASPWILLGLVALGAAAIHGSVVLQVGGILGITLVVVHLAFEAATGERCPNCGEAMPGPPRIPGRSSRIRTCPACGLAWRKSVLLGWRELDLDEIDSAPPTDAVRGPELPVDPDAESTQGRLLGNHLRRRGPRPPR